MPLYEKCSPGIRGYTLSDWEELGLDIRTIKSLDTFDALGAEMATSHAMGIAPILNELYIAVRDFNPEDRERS